MLRKCGTIETELVHNLSPSKKIDAIMKTEEDMKIEIKQEIILPNICQTEQDVIKDYKCVEENVKIEAVYLEEFKEEVKIEYEEMKIKSEVLSEAEVIFLDTHRTIDNYKYAAVKQEEELIIKNESDENYEAPADESYEDDNKSQNETNFEKSYNSSSRPRSGEKPNVCSVCNKAFGCPSALKTHSRIHTEEKPYSCEDCGKSFAVKGRLNVHKRIHTGEKPYDCSMCSKAFAQPSNLKTHMRTHTGSKSYFCGVCSKSYSRNEDLIAHKQTHTGKKSYFCSFCGKEFYNASAMNRHKRDYCKQNLVTNK